VLTRPLGPTRTTAGAGGSLSKRGAAETDEQPLLQVGEEVMVALEQAGFSVLLDDRDEPPGSKLKDADLIGIPVQVVIGKVWQAKGRLEVVERTSKQRREVERAHLLEAIQTVLDKRPSR